MDCQQLPTRFWRANGGRRTLFWLFLATSMLMPWLLDYPRDSYVHLQELLLRKAPPLALMGALMTNARPPATMFSCDPCFLDTIEKWTLDNPHSSSYHTHLTSRQKSAWVTASRSTLGTTVPVVIAWHNTHSEILLNRATLY